MAKGRCIGLAGTRCASVSTKEEWAFGTPKPSTKLCLLSRHGGFCTSHLLSVQECLKQDTLRKIQSSMQRARLEAHSPSEVFYMGGNFSSRGWFGELAMGPVSMSIMITGFQDRGACNHWAKCTAREFRRSAISLMRLATHGIIPRWRICSLQMTPMIF